MRNRRNKIQNYNSEIEEVLDKELPAITLKD
jgi:hypothetical protein